MVYELFHIPYEEVYIFLESSYLIVRNNSIIGVDTQDWTHLFYHEYFRISLSRIRQCILVDEYKTFFFLDLSHTIL